VRGWRARATAIPWHSLVRASPAKLVALFGQLQVEEEHRNMIVEELSRQRTCHAALSQPAPPLVCLHPVSAVASCLHSLPQPPLPPPVCHHPACGSGSGDEGGGGSECMHAAGSGVDITTYDVEYELPQLGLLLSLDWPLTRFGPASCCTSSFCVFGPVLSSPAYAAASLDMPLRRIE
jgi:hypothetical protein